MGLAKQGSMESEVSSEAAEQVLGTEKPRIPLTPEQKASKRKVRQYMRKLYEPVKRKYLNLPNKYTPLPWNFTGEQLRDLRRYFLLSQGQAVEKLNELLRSTEDKPKPEIALSTWQNWERGKTRPHMKTYILIAKLFAGEQEQSDREVEDAAMRWARSPSTSAWKPINNKKGKIKTPPWYENVKFRHLGTRFLSPFRKR